MNLPSDREVAEQLSRVRLDVLDATKHTRSPRHSTRYRVTRNVVVGGALIAALTGGSVYVATAPRGEIESVVKCYEAADLSSQSYAPVTGFDDPIETCGAAWRQGILGQGGAVDPNETDFPVPELVACEQRNGVAAVFPTEDTESDQGLCEALGLAVWDSD
jgi:hypothetical protein